MDQILRTIELEYTILEFHNNFVISRMREGVVFSKEQVRNLIEVCSDFYGSKKFVYISKRENNYNVDPTIYSHLEKVTNLAAIAIVSTKSSSINMANFEQKFCKVPFDIFMDLEDAVEWSREIIKK